MGKINVLRVILGGLLAGVVADLLGTLVDGMWLAQRWKESMAGLNHPPFTVGQIVAFDVLGLFVGIASIWLYAAIRPRFGAGPLTAAYVGIAVWFLGVFVPNMTFMFIPHLFSRWLMVYTTSAALVECVLATIAGAYLYAEGSAAASEQKTSPQTRAAAGV